MGDHWWGTRPNTLHWHLILCLLTFACTVLHITALLTDTGTSHIPKSLGIDTQINVVTHRPLIPMFDGWVKSRLDASPYCMMFWRPTLNKSCLINTRGMCINNRSHFERNLNICGPHQELKCASSPLEFRAAGQVKLARAHFQSVDHSVRKCAR